MDATRPRMYLPWLTMTLRIIVGLTFMISGILKGIDPWGFIFRIEDYLASWSMTEPRTIVLIVAIGVSTAEFVLGFLLATGCFRRTAPWWLMLMMAGFLPLSLYTWLANPVEDCGCFGELIHLSNQTTFWKNVVLVIFLAYLCAFNKRLRRRVYVPAIQWLPTVVTAFMMIAISLYGYNVQPLLDFRPYPAGTDLAALAPQADDDGGDLVFIYAKDGVEKIFSADNLPDSTWTFVRREYEESTATDDIAFAIFEHEEEVTDEVITKDGDMLLLVVPEAKRADIANTFTINEFTKAVRADGGDVACLIAADSEGIRRWVDLSMADYPCYTVDDTTLKQLARGTMSFVYLHEGVISWKMAVDAFTFDDVEEISSGQLKASQINPKYNEVLATLTLLPCAFLIIVALFQEFIIGIFHIMRKKYVTLHSEKQKQPNH